MKNANQDLHRLMRKLIPCLMVFILGIAFDIPADEQTSEKRYPVPGHGVLKLPVPASWVDKVDQPPEGRPPTITFLPASGESFKILITAMGSPQDDKDFNKPQRIQSLMEQRGKELLLTAEETELNLQGLRGPLSWGYYFSLTDKAPKPGEFKYLTQGTLGLGDLLITFTILTNEKEAEVIREARAMLRKASQDLPTPSQQITRKYRCGMLNFKMLVLMAAAAGSDFQEIKDIPGEYEVLLDQCNIRARENMNGIELTLAAEDLKRGRELLDVIMKNAEKLESSRPTINISEGERAEFETILNGLKQDLQKPAPGSK